MERFSRYLTRELPITGFAHLPANTQHILFHLAMAGIAGRDIKFLQSSRHSLTVKTVLEDLYLRGSLPDSVRQSLTHDLQLVWMGGGIYHESTGDRIEFTSTRDTLETCLRENAASLRTSAEEHALALFEMFDPSRPNTMGSPFAFVTHAADVTPEERAAIIERYKSLPNGAQRLGNLYLCRDDNGELVETYPCATGIYGPYLARVRQHLQHAMTFMDPLSPLYRSVQTLDRYFETGMPADFEAHAIAWVQDQEPSIFYSIGFIETYDDPMKAFGTFQSMVGFSDPTGSRLIQQLLSRVPQLEQDLPVHNDYKRPNPQGTVGGSTVLISYAGGPAPALPLGNCLPNSDKIRATFGSRSTIFSNVIDARAVPSRAVFERLLAPVYHANGERYLEMGYHIWVQLHECVGHASGVSRPHVSNQSLGSYYNIIEECRADLVALYFAGDLSMWTEILSDIAPDIQDVDLLIRTLYAQMIMDALYFQLTREPDHATRLSMTHFRNRQINALKALEIGLCNGGCHWEKGEFGPVIVIDQVAAMREAFGLFLGEIQRIKSEGDLDAAARLVTEFGTFIDPVRQLQAWERFESLPLSAYTGFYTPFFAPTGDPEHPYVLRCAPSFLEDQLALSELAETGQLPARVLQW